MSLQIPNTAIVRGVRDVTVTSIVINDGAKDLRKPTGYKIVVRRTTLKDRHEASSVLDW